MAKCQNEDLTGFFDLENFIYKYDFNFFRHYTIFPGGETNRFDESMIHGQPSTFGCKVQSNKKREIKAKERKIQKHNFTGLSQHTLKLVFHTRRLHFFFQSERKEIEKMKEKKTISVYNQPYF